MEPEKEQRIIDDCARFNQPLPDRIANAPELDGPLYFWFNAFLELSNNRPLGMSTGPIPVTAVLEYSRHYDLDSETENDLLYFVREMDSVFLSHIQKKNKIGKKTRPTR